MQEDPDPTNNSHETCSRSQVKPESQSAHRQSQAAAGMHCESGQHSCTWLAAARSKPRQPRNLPRMILLLQQWGTPIATKHIM